MQILMFDGRRHAVIYFSIPADRYETMSMKEVRKNFVEREDWLTEDNFRFQGPDGRLLSISGESRSRLCHAEDLSVLEGKRMASWRQILLRIRMKTRFVWFRFTFWFGQNGTISIDERVKVDASRAETMTLSDMRRSIEAQEVNWSGHGQRLDWYYFHPGFGGVAIREEEEDECLVERVAVTDGHAGDKEDPYEMLLFSF